MIGIALTLKLFLYLGNNAEGVVLRLDRVQRLCSPKWALQAEKWTFSNNNLEYLMKPQPDWKIYGLEFLGSTVGGVAGMAIGGYGCSCILAVLGASEGGPFTTFGPLLMAVIGAPIGSACGVAITGKLLKQEGSFWYALAGSALGTSVAVVTFVSGWMSPIEHIPLAIPLSIPVASSLGAVIAYNLLRGR